MGTKSDSSEYDVIVPARVFQKLLNCPKNMENIQWTVVHWAKMSRLCLICPRKKVWGGNNPGGKKNS